MKLAAIIVAAGNSSRMGFDKLMHPLQGQAVLQHSLNAFQHHPAFDQVIVVTPAARYQKLATESQTQQVNGAQHRHLSVMNGVLAVNDDISLIAVHDGARPLISASQIDLVLTAAKKHGAATSAKRITDTIKRGNSEDFSSAAVSRENLWAMETPQIFSASLLHHAYRQIIDQQLLVTDEVSAVELLNTPSKLVHNASANPKITFPEDITMAEMLLTNLPRS